MLNPIFNLPYYLIGMFFGLINFSVQNGISMNKLGIAESYIIIEMLGLYQRPDIEEEEKKDNYIQVNDKVIEFNDLGPDLDSEGRKSFATLSSKNGDEGSELNKSYQTKMRRKKINKSKKKKQKSQKIEKMRTKI